MRAVVLFLIVGCGAASIGNDELDLQQEPRALPARRAYLLLWNGSRIGHAVETLVPTRRGHRYERIEATIVSRAGTRVESRTRISVETDSELRAHRVYVETRVGAAIATGLAERTEDGRWRCQFGDESTVVLPADAEPSELVLYRLARRGERSYSGPVFLPGFGFASAALSIEAIGDHRLRATATTSAGSSASTITLRQDGTVDGIESDEPLSAARVEFSQIDDPFDPPEIVNSSAIDVRGQPAPRLIIDRPGPTAPTDLPGQTIAECGGAWHVTIDAPGKPDRQTAAVLRGLSRRTEALLDDQLDAPTASAGQALALGRGDCTAHARVFAELARERGYNVALATGFRNHRGKLVRHRWNVVETEAGWVTVDPTYGESPVQRGVVIALAIHGESTREIGMIDETVFAGLGAATARYVESFPDCK